MNCQTCFIRFKRLKDVIQHSTTKRHSHTSFLCIPCVLSLPNVIDVVQHIASKEHYITALATGVHFDMATNYMPATFPPNNFCLLCSVRDSSPNNYHLKTDKHRYMAWLLRTMITSKKMHCSDTRAFDRTEEFISKMINAKHNTRFYDVRGSKESLRFTCKLCNLHFVHPEYLNRHLADESHKRMKEFMIQISHIAREIAIIGAGSNTDVSKAFSNSLRALYYCEVCCIWIDARFNYIQHMKGFRHKTTELAKEKSSKQERSGNGVSADVVHCYPMLGKRSAREEPKASKPASKKLKTSSSNPKHHYDSKDTKHHKDISKFVEKELRKCRCSTCATIRENHSLDFEVGDSKSHSQKHASPRITSLACIETGKDTPRLELENGESASNSNRHDFENMQANVDLDKEHYCELCEFLCYNSLHYGKHLMGAQHIKMRRMINRKAKVNIDIQECRTPSDSHPLKYNCELCDVSNQDSQSYEFHLNSAKHKKNKWMLYVLKQRPI